MRITQLSKFAAFTALIALLSACGPMPTGTQPPTNPQSTPTLEPSPTPSAGVCSNAFAPVKVGATWTYDTTSGTTDEGALTTTITDVRADGFTLAAKFADGTTVSQDWTCKPEGLMPQSLGAGQAALGLSAEGIQANFTTSNANGVALASNVQPGTTWNYGLDIAGSIAQGSLNADLKGAVPTAMQAIGTESVTVPAGTFNAMKVQATSNFNVMATFHGLGLPFSSVVNTTFWMAPGVGLVKSTETGELAGTALSATSELQSYTIP